MSAGESRRWNALRKREGRNGTNGELVRVKRKEKRGVPILLIYKEGIETSKTKRAAARTTGPPKLNLWTIVSVCVPGAYFIAPGRECVRARLPASFRSMSETSRRRGAAVGGYFY